MIRRMLCALALALVLIPAGHAVALTVNEVAREVRCPTCNTPLDVSNAPVAVRMKAYIAERIERGLTKDQIIDALVAEFGPSVRATPPGSGFGLVAWLVPAIAVLAGLAAVPLVARSWSRRARLAGPEPAPPSPEEQRRLDDELRRLGP